MMIRSLRACVAAALLLVTCFDPGVSHAIVNGTLPSCADRRFDAVGLFLTSGPFACGGFVSGSCVLVESDLVLFARHELDVAPFEPLPDPVARPYYVRFRRAESGAAVNTAYLNGDPCHGVYQEIRVMQFFDAVSVGSDLVLGRLEHPPRYIRPVGIEMNQSTPALSQIIVAAWGWAGPCWQSGDAWGLRVGRGVIPQAAPTSSLSFSFSSCTISPAPTCQRCPVGGPWVSVNLHDSGGGVFIEVPSTNPIDREPELRLLGIISTVQAAHRPALWNQAGGLPRLKQTPALSPEERGDFNRDGLRNVADVFDLLQEFVTQECIADFNQDGVVSSSDMLDYLALYFTN